MACICCATSAQGRCSDLAAWRSSASRAFEPAPGGSDVPEMLRLPPTAEKLKSLRYFDYHDALFRTQQEWSPSGNPAGAFVDLADDLGLDTSEFRSCLQSDRYADVVTANLTLGQRLGVSGTPTIFVHDGQGPARRLGGFQFIDVQQAMEATTGNE